MTSFSVPDQLPTPSGGNTFSTLSDFVNVQVRFNGVDFPVSVSTFQELRIASNIHTVVPTVTFKSTDILSFLTNFQQTDASGTGLIGDGITVEIGVSDGTLKPELNKFRIMSIPRIKPGSGHPDIDVVAVLDALKWWRQTVRGAFRGTSTEILRKLAAECGLGFYGPHDFNDSMVWIPANQNYSKFANSITSHAWADDSSCASFCLDKDKVLRYVDLNRLADEKPIARARHLVSLERDTDFEVVYAEVRTPSGAGNLVHGYSGTTTEETLSGQVRNYETVSAVKQGGFFNISSEVKEELSNVNAQFSALDCGNFHHNYRRAEYQNRRLSSIFSTHVDIYVEQLTNIGLLETVEYNTVDSEGQVQGNHSGIYFVTAKVVGINGNRYFEKLRLTSNSKGINIGGKML